MAVWLGLVVILEAAAVLSGWALDIAFLRAPIAHVAMKANTAASLLLLGFVLAFAASPRFAKTKWPRVLLVVPLAFGVLSAAEYVVRVDLHIDQLLFRDPSSSYTAPGRMGFATAIGLTLLSIALGALDRGRCHRFRLTDICAALTLMLATVGVADYASDWKPSMTGVAAHTVIALLFLGIGVLAARPSLGWIGILTSSYGGSRAARRLIPFTVVVPILVAALRWIGHTAGVFDREWGDALMISATVVLLLMVILWNASESNRIDKAAAIERVRAECELEKAAHYSRSLLEASLDPLVTISKSGLISDANRAAELITGLDRSRLVGSDFSSYFTDPELARKGYEQVFAVGSVRDYPLQLKTSSGGAIDVLYNASVYRNESGDVEGVFAAARDVTERARAEQAVKESEGRYRSLVAATAQIIWTTDPEGQVIADMPTWRAFTGMNYDEIQGSGWLNSVHPDDRARTASVWAEAVRTRSLYETEYRIRRSDGEYRDMMVRGAPVFGADGATIREWVGVCSDITDKKRVERRVRDQADLINRAHDAIFVWNLDGKIVFWNRGAEELYGFTAAEAIGRGVHDFLGTVLPLSPDDVNLELSKRAEWQGRLQQIRKDGTPIVVTSRWSLVRNDSGKLSAMLEINRDITAVVKMEAALAERSAELERSNRELQEFASIASHDLQEPLRKVNAFGDRLRSHCETTLDGQGLDYLARMQSAAQRMSILIESLLQYSRVTTKAQPSQQVDLNQVAAEVLGDLEARVESSGALVSIGPLPTVHADKTQMRQLFQNLLGNALKFHQPDTPPKVEVVAKAEGGGAVDIIFRDEGVGFDEVYADRIFRPFQRLHTRAEFEGSGIGLAICRKIVQRHNGSIAVKSSPGHGTTFTVSLPAKPESQKESTHDLAETAAYSDR